VSKLRKKSIIGWVGRKWKLEQWNILYSLIDVYCKRGKREDWFQSDWPPRKVKITVEEVGNE
jgi:hypothetical protein